MECTEKIRILIGLKTDVRTFELLEDAKRQGSLRFVSHAGIRDRVEPNLRHEFEADVEEHRDVEGESASFSTGMRAANSKITRFHGDDLAAQGLKFPEVASPVPVFYELSKRENEIFTRTTERITKQITYARYRPLTYYAGKLDENVTAALFNLAGFMKVLPVKRPESSFEAFRLTLRASYRLTTASPRPSGAARFSSS